MPDVTSAPLVEKDPKQIEDLDELQMQARQNTKELSLLRRKSDAEQNQDTKQEISQEIYRRRSRSAALLRRRKELQDRDETKRREREDALRRELAQRFHFPIIEERKKELLSQLVSLASDAEQAQAIARGELRRSESVLLAANARWAHVAYEALKKAPPLVLNDEKEENED
jgi:hypothetical protein